MTRLIVGCGYLGSRVARRWLEQGQTVFALTRSDEHAAELARLGARPVVADVTRPETLRNLPSVQTVLYAIGYDRRAGQSRRAVQIDGLRAVLQSLPAGFERLIYISSTSVYGDSGGQWIQEDSPCLPTREAGRVLLAAEQLLAAHPISARTIVLRLAGLYGPGRIPRLADLVAGRPIPVSRSGHLNLIHVDDAASIVLAAEQHAAPPRTYLVSDGHPTTRRAFYQRLAQLLGLAPPLFTEPSPGDDDALRSMADKRVDNSRMLAELAVSLAYPSYQEGLAAMLA